jgi:hypothetical protein
LSERYSEIRLRDPWEIHTEGERKILEIHERYREILDERYRKIQGKYREIQRKYNEIMEDPLSRKIYSDQTLCFSLICYGRYRKMRGRYKESHGRYK